MADETGGVRGRGEAEHGATKITKQTSMRRHSAFASYPYSLYSVFAFELNPSTEPLLALQIKLKPYMKPWYLQPVLKLQSNIILGLIGSIK
jgi:hypothetical protein